jgi:signal transduction histidine kinase
MTTPDLSSATLGDVTPPRESTTGRPGRYAQLWRQVPRELGFLALTMPIAILGLSVLSTLFFTGVGTLIIYIGLFIVLAALYTSRGFGALETVRLRWAGETIATPRWRSGRGPAGFWRTTFGPYTNGHYWLYLLHTLIVNPIVSIVSWTLTVTWVATAAGGLSYWFWNAFLPNDDQDVFLSHVIFSPLLPESARSFDPVIGDAVLYFIAGVVFLITMPFVMRGLTLLHAVIARGMLGAWRSEALQQEVADLDASRDSAVLAEDRALRRIERDLHDGPQQRLIRLQMDLASAGRKLDADPEATRALLDEAAGHAKDALEELRALSRGFAPPLLQDRGLVVALDALAARSTVPTTFETSLQPSERIQPELERSAYFIAAELLTNVAKHAAAQSARVRLETVDDAARAIVLTVTDDGRGGATARAGHGLDGLIERVRGLRGTMTIDSPAGGPTLISVTLPVPHV